MGQLKKERFSYRAQGVDMVGHLVWDATQPGPRPGVLVAPEWWGCNEYACGRADMLAELGYAALALDLYGAGQVASSPDEAGAFMGALTADMSITQARFSAALNAFGALEQVDERQLAAIGYCFGGGVVLHMARKGLPLQAAASFHGSVGLAACDGVSPVPTRLVAYHGDEDQLIAAEDMAAYLRTMDDAGANHQLVQLPGALHGFSNPAATAKGQEYGLPLAYDELADRCSWAHVQMLLRETFKDSGDSA